MFGGSGPATLTVSDSIVSNGGAGYPAIAADGARAGIVVAGNTVVDNASLGLYQTNGAVFESRGDNTVRNNNGDGIQMRGTITTCGGL